MVDVHSAARAPRTSGAGLSGFPSISARIFPLYGFTLYSPFMVMQTDTGLLIDHLRVAFNPSILFKHHLRWTTYVSLLSRPVPPADTDKRT